MVLTLLWFMSYFIILLLYDFINLLVLCFVILRGSKERRAETTEAKRREEKRGEARRREEKREEKIREEKRR